MAYYLSFFRKVFMEQDKMNKDENANRGSGPLPEEAFNKGDGKHDEEKAHDKEFLKDTMKGNLETAGKDNTSGSATEHIDEQQKKANENEQSQETDDDTN